MAYELKSSSRIVSLAERRTSSSDAAHGPVQSARRRLLETSAAYQAQVDAAYARFAFDIQRYRHRGEQRERLLRHFARMDCARLRARLRERLL